MNNHNPHPHNNTFMKSTTPLLYTMTVGHSTLIMWKAIHKNLLYCKMTYLLKIWFIKCLFILNDEYTCKHKVCGTMSKFLSLAIFKLWLEIVMVNDRKFLKPYDKGTLTNDTKVVEYLCILWNFTKWLSIKCLINYVI